MDDERFAKWRQEQKDKQRAYAKQQAARLKADPRVQAMKQAAKERAKAQRKKIAAERKQRRQENVGAERKQRRPEDVEGERAAPLRLVRPPRDS